MHYKSKIIAEVLKILKQAKNKGIEINGTKEINNTMSVFKMSELDIEKEEKAIMKFYDEYIGSYTERIKLETSHYNMLKYTLLHKPDMIRYFHKEENMSSRKFVIHSNDCIAAIQLLCRPQRNMLNIFIRSSDILNLLLVDYLWMIKMLNEVLEDKKVKSTKDDIVTFFTTSSHYYLANKTAVNDVLKDGKHSIS